MYCQHLIIIHECSKKVIKDENSKKKLHLVYRKRKKRKIRRSIMVIVVRFMHGFNHGTHCGIRQGHDAGFPPPPPPIEYR